MELVNSYIFQSGLVVTIQVVTMDFGFWVQNTILRFFQVSLKSFFTTKKKRKRKRKKMRVKKKYNIIALIHYVGGHIVKLIRDIHIPYSLSNQWTQKISDQCRRTEYFHKVPYNHILNLVCFNLQHFIKSF